MSGRSASTFLEPPGRNLPDRRHSSDQSRTSPTNMSRNNSTSSLSSRKSEPGWLTSMNNVDRNRSGSVPAAKPASGFGKLFGKKKEKKDMEQVVLTSRHAAAVKTKLALDPKFKGARRDSAPVYVASSTQNSLLISAGEQEMRHPHSGPPATYSLKEDTSMPKLARIVSGDERDEPDEWEKMREEWRHRKLPTLDNSIIEGVAVDGSGSGHESPEEKGEAEEVEIPPSEVLERQGVRILAVAGLKADEAERRPSRAHTPIGGRFHRDEKGAWKR